MSRPFGTAKESQLKISPKFPTHVYIAPFLKASYTYVQMSFSAPYYLAFLFLIISKAINLIEHNKALSKPTSTTTAIHQPKLQ